MLPPEERLKRGEVLLQYTRVLAPPEYAAIPFHKQQVKTIKADLSWTFTKLMKKIHKHDAGGGSGNKPPQHIKELLWEVAQKEQQEAEKVAAMKKAFKDRFTGIKGLSRFGHREHDLHAAAAAEELEEQNGDDGEAQEYGEGNDDGVHRGAMPLGSDGDYTSDAETDGDVEDDDDAPPPPPPNPPEQPAPPEDEEVDVPAEGEGGENAAAEAAEAVEVNADEPAVVDDAAEQQAEEQQAVAEESAGQQPGGDAGSVDAGGAEAGADPDAADGLLPAHRVIAEMSGDAADPELQKRISRSVSRRPSADLTAAAAAGEGAAVGEDGAPVVAPGRRRSWVRGASGAQHDLAAALVGGLSRRGSLDQGAGSRRGSVGGDAASAAAAAFAAAAGSAAPAGALPPRPPRRSQAPQPTGDDAEAGAVEEEKKEALAELAEPTRPSSASLRRQQEQLELEQRMASLAAQREQEEVEAALAAADAELAAAAEVDETAQQTMEEAKAPSSRPVSRPVSRPASRPVSRPISAASQQRSPEAADPSAAAVASTSSKRRGERMQPLVSSTSSKRGGGGGAMQLEEGGVEEDEEAKQQQRPGTADEEALAVASTSSKRREAASADTAAPAVSSTSSKRRVVVGPFLSGAGTASTSSKRAVALASSVPLPSAPSSALNSLSSKRRAAPLGAGEYLLDSAMTTQGAEVFYDMDAIRAAQEGKDAAAEEAAAAAEPEPDFDESLQPRIVAGSVLVSDDILDDAAALAEEAAEREAEEALKVASSVDREPPRPYGFLPFVKVTRNGFTREVRIPHFGDKYIDPPLSWLREKYRFAAPAGIHAFVTLHAYGYRVWAKNNVKF